MSCADSQKVNHGRTSLKQGRQASTCMLQQTSSPLAVAAPSMDSRCALAGTYATLCHMESHEIRQEYLAVKYTALLSVIIHF